MYLCSMESTFFYNLQGTLASNEQLHQMAQELEASGAEFLLLQLQEGDYQLDDIELRRLQDVLRDSGAPMLYANYRRAEEEEMDALQKVELIDYQFGSLRDDFDFGPLVLLQASAVLEADGFVMGDWVDEEDALSYKSDLKYAAWYQLRLLLSLRALPFHLNEQGYTFVPRKRSESAEQQQFAYVDPRNREVQIEYEQVVTQHLRDLDALVDAKALKSAQSVDAEANAASNNVAASVVIPVFNRVKTIRDAIQSALSQECAFPFNVLVVDNYSTDGTGQIISELAQVDPRVVQIVPESKTLSIG